MQKREKEEEEVNPPTPTSEENIENKNTKCNIIPSWSVPHTRTQLEQQQMLKIRL